MENDFREENRYFYLYYENFFSMFIQDVFFFVDFRNKF